MPKSPEQYAQVVDNLIAGTPATPRNVEITSMTRRGIKRRRLEDDIIISNIKQMIAKYRAQGIRRNVNRQALCAIVKYVMGPINAVGSSILKRYMGISSQMWKRIGEKQSMISCVKKNKIKGIIDEKLVGSFYID